MCRLTCIFMSTHAFDFVCLYIVYIVYVCVCSINVWVFSSLTSWPHCTLTPAGCCVRPQIPELQHRDMPIHQFTGLFEAVYRTLLWRWELEQTSEILTHMYSDANPGPSAGSKHQHAVVFTGRHTWGLSMHSIVHWPRIHAGLLCTHTHTHTYTICPHYRSERQTPQQRFVWVTVRGLHCMPQIMGLRPYLDSS